MSRDLLKVGMVSFAHASHPGRYFDALQARDDVEVIGIWDDRPERVDAHASAHATPRFDDVAALLSASDAVVICSEYSRHRDHVVAALDAGVHVLCAKPIAHARDDATAILNAARASDRVVMVSLPCRSLAPVQEARRLVVGGAIGQIVSISGTNRGACPGDWFVDPAVSGGGAIMDHTAHMVDLIRWISGSEIVRVHALAGTRILGLDVEDAGLLQLTLDSGAIASIDTSWSRLPPIPNPMDITMRITGTRGSVHVDALAQRIDVYAEGVEWRLFGGDMDAELIAGFVSAARGGQSPPITIDDGFAATIPAFAAYDSLKSGSPIAM